MGISVSIARSVDGLPVYASSADRHDTQQSVQQNMATRCQKCSYKKGLCAICGTMVLDVRGECSLSA